MIYFVGLLLASELLSHSNQRSRLFQLCGSNENRVYSNIDRSSGIGRDSAVGRIGLRRRQAAETPGKRD